MELGNLAVQIIMDYAYVMEELAHISTIFNDTEAIFQSVIYQRDLNFSLQASNAVNMLSELLNSAENQSIYVQQLIVDFSQVQESSARTNASAIIAFTTQLMTDLTSLHRAVTMAVTNAHTNLITVDNDVFDTHNTSTQVSTFRSTILSRALSVSTIITETSPVSIITGNILQYSTWFLPVDTQLN